MVKTVSGMFIFIYLCSVLSCTSVDAAYTPILRFEGSLRTWEGREPARQELPVEHPLAATHDLVVLPTVARDSHRMGQPQATSSRVPESSAGDTLLLSDPTGAYVSREPANGETSAYFSDEAHGGVIVPTSEYLEYEKDREYLKGIRNNVRELLQAAVLERSELDVLEQRSSFLKTFSTPQQYDAAMRTAQRESARIQSRMEALSGEIDDLSSRSTGESDEKAREDARAAGIYAKTYGELKGALESALSTDKARMGVYRKACLFFHPDKTQSYHHDIAERLKGFRQKFPSESDAFCKTDIIENFKAAFKKLPDNLAGFAGLAGVDRANLERQGVLSAKRVEYATLSKSLRSCKERLDDLAGGRPRIEQLGKKITDSRLAQTFLDRLRSEESGTQSRALNSIESTLRNMSHISLTDEQRSVVNDLRTELGRRYNARYDVFTGTSFRQPPHEVPDAASVSIPVYRAVYIPKGASLSLPSNYVTYNPLDKSLTPLYDPVALIGYDSKDRIHIPVVAAQGAVWKFLSVRFKKQKAAAIADDFTAFLLSQTTIDLSNVSEVDAQKVIDSWRQQRRSISLGRPFKNVKLLALCIVSLVAEQKLFERFPTEKMSFVNSDANHSALYEHVAYDHDARHRSGNALRISLYHIAAALATVPAVGGVMAKLAYGIGTKSSQGLRRFLRVATSLSALFAAWKLQENSGAVMSFFGNDFGNTVKRSPVFHTLCEAYLTLVFLDHAYERAFVCDAGLDSALIPYVQGFKKVTNVTSAAEYEKGLTASISEILDRQTPANIALTAALAKRVPGVKKYADILRAHGSDVSFGAYAAMMARLCTSLVFRNV